MSSLIFIFETTLSLTKLIKNNETSPLFLCVKKNKTKKKYSFILVLSVTKAEIYRLIKKLKTKPDDKFTNFVFHKHKKQMIIKLRGINKTYNNGAPLHVLKGIDLDIERGEMVAIMGASGSGKSTLLNILGILDTYDSGTYYLDNQLIKDLSESRAAELRNRMIGFIFQSFNLISFKNAMENVALPLYYQGISRKKRNAMAIEYLDKVGLKDWANHMPGEMSGGQKQRVAIARALIAKPQVILADEPTGALDSKTTVEVMELLREVNREGMSMIIVTHEQSVAETTNRIIHVKDGVIEKDYV